MAMDMGIRIYLLFFIIWTNSFVCEAFRSSFRSSLRSRTNLKCPPEEELLPCVCILRETEVHVRCENSEISRVGAALEVLKRRELPVEELYLVANRMPSIPARFFGSLEIHKLYLLDNEMVSISRNAFAGLEASLTNFYIRESSLEDVPFDAFDNLRELRSIIIEQSSVSTIPRLYTLPHLELLKIDSSRVSEIDPQSFRTMASLRKIQISTSNVNTLGENSMEGLLYLKEINLSNNNITWIHPGAFRNLEMVEELDLKGNNIVDAALAVMAARELRSLKKFNIANNKIQKLGRATFVDMPNLEIVILSNNLIELIDSEAMYKLPNLKKLDLGNNNIYHFEANVFTDVPSLEFLVLGNNNLSFLEDLKYVYRSLPNLKTLDLSSNHIRGGNGHSLGGHSKLESLILNQNFITDIDKNLFRSLPNLRELHLSQNHIKRYNENKLWDLPKLQLLDLSYNDITNIDGNFYSGLPSLTDLILSFNIISEISTKAFYETNQLKSLNISNNKIKKIYPKTFLQIPDLYELDLNNNELASLDEGLFDGLSSLERLYISKNQIRSVSGRAFSDTVKLKFLDMSFNLLEHIPSDAMSTLTSLHRLNLKNNGIRSVHRGSFSQLRIMETMDLSHNHIQTLDRIAFSEMNVLRDLDLSVNYIQNLPPNIFSNMNLIEKLNISNNFIATIGNDALKNVQRLRILDLTNNSLTSIGHTFHDMASLQGLFLSHNYINKLTNDTFINLPTLNVLIFNNNGLQTFDVGTFYNLSSLMFLDLADNNLIEINAYSFSSLKSLRELKLSHNQIASIHDYSFMNLQGLQRLELQDNVIIYISNQAFDKLPSLKFLNLSRNGLQEVPERALSKVPTLDVLDLSWNYIVELTDSNFRDLQWLTVLLLSNNDLCYLSPNSFSGPRSLRVLMLQNNQLKRLHLSALQEPIQSLSILDMAGNPFICDCELIWLREYLQHERDRKVNSIQHVQNYFRGSAKHGTARNLLPAFPGPLQGKPICAGPPEYAGMVVTEVPPEAFFCNGFRDTEERRERCIPRFIDPQIFTAGGSGNGLAPEVLNTLLKLSNLSEILPSDADSQSYLDYNNPIVVSGLSELISNYSKFYSNGKGKIPVLNYQTTKPTVIKKPISSVSSDFVTGDTPTIYAGPPPNKVPESQEDGKDSNTGNFFGFKLPGFPSILDTIGKFKLPNLGLNVDWAGLPFGRIEDRKSFASINDAINPLLQNLNPTRGPDSDDKVWVQVVQNKDKESLFSSLPKNKTSITANLSGRGNHTNHAKFYETRLPPFVNKGKDPIASLNVDEEPIAFSEPHPGDGFVGTVNQDTQTAFRPPILTIGPGPNSGTPFLPGLVTNKNEPLPLVPNRDFQQYNQRTRGLNNSDIRGIIPETPNLKFPGNKDESESWRWSPPEGNLYSGLSPYPPEGSFQPIKTIYPNMPIKNANFSHNFPMTSNRLPNNDDVKNIYSTDTSDDNKYPGTSMNNLFTNNPNTLPEMDDFSTTKGPFQNVEKYTLDSLPSSTSPYDDWTKSFVESDVEATTQSYFIFSDNSQTTERNGLLTNEEDKKDLTGTENYVPVSLLPNTHTKINNDSNHKIDEFKDSTSELPKYVFENSETTTVNPVSSTQSSIESQNTYTTVNYVYYPTQQDDLFLEDGTWKDDQNFWPPVSLGEGISLVQNVKDTDSIHKSEIAEAVNKTENLINGAKHVSPSRSISLGSGIPSVEKVKQDVVQGVDLPPQYPETLEEPFTEVEIITEAMPEDGRKAGIMDWYYSNYNRFYDPDAHLPMGGNQPSSSQNLKLSIHLLTLLVVHILEYNL
ncbi:UNVERIFIED_CONTAM: hypothetical protein RMT77_011396 [Armadillidium vulgare]